MTAMETPGSLLKKARKRTNISIEDASFATKIRAEYLRALEKDEFKRFPSSVYAKGFLISYSKFLGVKTDRVLALYRRSVEETAALEIKPSRHITKQPKIILTPTVVITTVFVLIVVAVISYLIFQFYSFQKPPDLVITSPQGNITTDQSELKVEGKTDPGMFVTINDEAIRIDADGTFSIPVTLSKGSNTIIIKARHPDSIGKEAQVTLSISYEPPKNGEPQVEDEDEQTEENVPPPAPETMAVQISIGPENAWLEVEIDGESVFSTVAEGNTNLEYTAEREVYVRTGKLSSTNLVVNGEARVLLVEGGGIASIRCIISDSTVSCEQP